MFGEYGSKLVGALTARNETLAVAESCTGGRISAIVTAVAGASRVFRLGVVSYSNDSKVGVLGVNQNTLDAYGAVSRETVAEMAAGVRRQSGACWGLATSGIAGPSGGSESKPVGCVWVGVCGEATAFEVELSLGNLKTREEIQVSASRTAVDLLNNCLVERAGQSGDLLN